MQAAAAPIKSVLTDIIRKHSTSSLRLAGAGLVLTAGAGAAGLAVSAPAHAATASPAAAARLTDSSVADPAAGSHPRIRAAPSGRTAESPGSRAHSVRSATAAVRPPAAAKPAATIRELVPRGTKGPQAWMPLGHDQLTNASTIVHQAIATGMGPRSAVIAVATAMQESRLVNIGYGTSDSLGLFQQQPDCGWGTAQQVMNPKYATDAFLRVLREHQASDPGWASQPLWASAQTVQRSAAPFAYARWESQAAHLVSQFLH